MNVFGKSMLLLLLSVISGNPLIAQMITGIWQGRIGNGVRSIKVELKLVAKGDSLTGTSYYYTSSGNYTRYAIKGFFDPQTNSVIWWDDELIEKKQEGVRIGNKESRPLLTEADFNCPGSGRMMLDGKSVEKSNKEDKGELHLTKTDRPLNRDEWDELIANYTTGGNDPDVIATTESYWKHKHPSSGVSITEVKTDQPPLETEVKVQEPVLQVPPTTNIESPPVTSSTIPTTIVVEKKQPEIQKSFEERKKVFIIDIPLKGDSIEIHFYDNAEIDGDSISLFLNNRMQFEHVRLSEKAYTVKFAVKDLNEVNELVMVAENLGAIPPNTSYMVAYVNGERITANLESTENSSAMIRLVKPK